MFNLMNEDIKKLLFKFATARIDIKNEGGPNNKIKILNVNDDYSKISRPTWFNKGDGEGIIIESFKGSIDFKIQCKSNGNLNLAFRSPDIRDKNNDRFPIYIDYTKLLINGENHIVNHVLTSHNSPYKIQKAIMDNDVFDIHLEWLPFNSNCVYGHVKPHDFHKDLVTEINKLKSEINLIHKNIDSCNDLFNTIYLDYSHSPNKILNNFFILSKELLDFVNNLCVTNKIKWWMDGGTLLGAIRHENFIPWDDDLDIAMIRKDYLRFDKLIHKAIKQYNLDDLIDIHYRARKIDDKEVGSFIQIFIRQEFDDGREHIIGGVDIFPFDYIVNYDPINIDNVYYESKLRYFRNLSNHNSKSLEILFNDLNLSLNEAEYIIPGVEGSFGPNNVFDLKIFDSKDIFPLKQTVFGGKVFPIPNNYDFYLKSLYGDYMTIPKNIHVHNRIRSFRSQNNINELFSECIGRIKEINMFYDKYYEGSIK